jgi:hypothetical protein
MMRNISLVILLFIRLIASTAISLEFMLFFLFKEVWHEGKDLRILCVFAPLREAFFFLVLPR